MPTSIVKKTMEITQFYLNFGLSYNTEPRSDKLTRATLNYLSVSSSAYKEFSKQPLVYYWKHPRTFSLKMQKLPIPTLYTTWQRSASTAGGQHHCCLRFTIFPQKTAGNKRGHVSARKRRTEGDECNRREIVAPVLGDVHLLKGWTPTEWIESL